jgi:thiamine biosynthesis lipoprotein
VAFLEPGEQREAVAAQASNAPGEALKLEVRGDNLLAVCFTAMASPCEVLLPSTADAAAQEFGNLVAQEAWRVEKKFSRYRNDSVTAWIHENRGTRIEVDAETASLIDFARRCFNLSEGLFDVTSGVLRRAWIFDGSDRVPDAAAIERLMPLVGFGKIQWESPYLMLPAGMELDFGGFGKEYAVDRAYDLMAARRPAAFLINFGGDLRANRPPPYGPWQIGVERPDTDRQATLILELEHGALATSGDSRRYLLKDGVRYGHVLDPRTGWPVSHAPRSVTVAASSCTEAGLLATLALLHGARADDFLADQGVRYWLLA